MPQATFKRNAHAAYFNRCLSALPSQAQDHDSNRVTIAFFCLAGLDLLGKLDPKPAEREGWIDWLWSLQAPEGGFRGSTFMNTPAGTSSAPAHLPSTYTALCCLALLRAPLEPLDRPGLKRFLAACQGSDGSLSPTPGMEGAFQNDARMAYCAAVSARVAGVDGSLDVGRVRGFLDSCRSWEGGYGARPGLEAQGGTTYCSLAALSLLGGLDTVDTTDTVRWLTQRQIGGFQGRPGKLEDVCYSFWCGGALAAASKADLVNAGPNTAFLLDAQSPIGGFGKAPEDFPDPFHSYLALAALALTPARDELGLKELDPVWNLTPDARDWLIRV